ncbi:MAG: CrcB family protein [Ignavibacteria bacterium]|nr:CrcB family protein [Ignavibacteria bacterium]
MMINALIVFFGGGIGSLLRYGVQLIVASPKGTLPLATLLVNIIGSLAIGVVSGYMTFSSQNWNRDAMLFAGIGLCGGFTTFSAFSLELSHMIHQEAYFSLAMYITASIMLGVISAMGGIWIGKTLAG